MGFLSGKKLLITGVLSNRSIAYGIAKACHEQGAELAFSYVGERFKDRITEFAADFDSKLIFVYDPVGKRIETTIYTGRGPHSLAIDTVNGLGYIGHFTDSYVGVVDLNKAHGATYGKMVLTLGEPQTPRAAK